MWYSSGEVPENIAFLPHRFGSGDRIVKLVDFNLSDVAGYRMKKNHSRHEDTNMWK